MTTAQFQLAMIYEGRKEWEKAADRYHKVLDTETDNAIALNNLAYVYAVRLNRPQQALPIAEQAYKVSKAAPIADTLAWTLHLLGDNDKAATIAEIAVGGAPTNIEILVHAATIHVALGEFARAKLELDAAVKADPAAASRDDVKALRDKIKQP
jgi:Flp pilus assembly protein TadD